MTVSPPIVLTAATAGLAGLVVHSLRRWGVRRTLVFYGASLLWMSFKELRSTAAGEYIVLMEGTRVFGVAPLLPVGWTFAFALAWHLAEPIAERARGTADRILPTFAVAAVGVLLISYLMEVTGIGMGWWQWTVGTVILDAPLEGAVMRIFGWGWQALIFYLAVATMECRQIPLWTLRYLGGVVAFFVLRLPGWIMGADHNWMPAIFPAILVAAAFVDGPRFLPTPRRQPSTVDLVPYGAAALMVAVCVAAHGLVLREPSLMLAALPITIYAGVSGLCLRSLRRS